MIDWYFDEPTYMVNLSTISFENEDLETVDDEFVYERYDVLIRFVCEDGVKYILKDDPHKYILD